MSSAFDGFDFFGLFVGVPYLDIFLGLFFDFVEGIKLLSKKSSSLSEFMA